jgi:predicted nucleic acid-binding protein
MRLVVAGTSPIFYLLCIGQIELLPRLFEKIFGAGEGAAITLALSIHADLILIDERKGTSIDLVKGFEVTGTLGILRLAARAGWINIAQDFQFRWISTGDTSRSKPLLWG